MEYERHVSVYTLPGLYMFVPSEKYLTNVTVPSKGRIELSVNTILVSSPSMLMLSDTNPADAPDTVTVPPVILILSTLP